MFAHTGFDAYFSYLALSIHANFVNFLTSNEFFKGLMIFIFAAVFFIVTIQYFSRHLPGSVFDRKYVTISKFFKVVVCFVLGVSILKVDTPIDVKNFDRKSWSGNKFVVEKIGDYEPELRVSFVVDIAVRVIEEFGWGATKVVDWALGSTHSQTKAPNFYYKSLFYAASSQVSDPELRETLEIYSKECVWKALPEVEVLNQGGLLGRLHGLDELPQKINEIYNNTIVQEKEGETKTCNDLRYEVNASLYRMVNPNKSVFERLLEKAGLSKKIRVDSLTNMEISAALLKFYRGQRESGPGVMKGAEVPGLYGRFWQYIGKSFSFEGAKRYGDNDSYAGASLAVDKAKEFNELLRRAPLIQGLIKVLLIGFIAPFLAFLVCAGNFKSLIWWCLVYGSVVSWTPIWTGLYSLMTNFAYHGKMAAQFGVLSDGFSLVAANSIMSDAYYIYSLIFWAMCASAIGITGGVIYFARGMLSDNREDHIPDAIPQVANTALMASTAGRMIK